MSEDSERRVDLTRVAEGVYLARNARGVELRFGSKDPDGFSPTELLLAAVAGCSAVDVDVVTGRRAEAEEFTVTAQAVAVRDESGNSLRDIEVTFRLRFADTGPGREAQALVPRVLRTSHDRTCTVSRTLEAGTPVTLRST